MLVSLYTVLNPNPIAAGPSAPSDGASPETPIRMSVRTPDLSERH